jgi:para-nitrobenzyl esterase
VPRSDATETAQMILKKLNLDKGRVEALQNISTQQLLDLTAANPALRLTPVVDGSTLPAHPFDPAATGISADIPLMIGSTETEVTWNPNTNYDPLDDTALRDRVKQTLRVDEAAADQVIAVYRKGRPKAGNLDLYLILASDASNFRTGTDTEAERKAALGKASVYKYYFRWYSPVREGKLRSMHTMDIPFVFENVLIAKTEIGEGRELYPLAEKMSGAWVAFARTGNPNHKGLANWPAFAPDRRATMIFNNECKVVNDPYHGEKAAIRAVQPART